MKIPDGIALLPNSTAGVLVPLAAFLTIFEAALWLSDPL
jgi:hypothetical protein